MRARVRMMRARVRTSVPSHNSRRARLHHIPRRAQLATQHSTLQHDTTCCNVAQHADTRLVFAEELGEGRCAFLVEHRVLHLVLETCRTRLRRLAFVLSHGATCSTALHWCCPAVATRCSTLQRCALITLRRACACVQRLPALQRVLRHLPQRYAALLRLERSRTVARGIPRHVGYRDTWDIVTQGYRAAWGAVPHWRLCRVGCARSVRSPGSVLWRCFLLCGAWRGLHALWCAAWGTARDELFHADRRRQRPVRTTVLRQQQPRVRSVCTYVLNGGRAR